MKHWGLFIRNPAISRLALISQSGVLRLIAPELNRTRLAHSVGVAVVASRISLHLGLDRSVAKQFELAALAHDVGHGPFSHIFDEVTGVSHEERTVDIIKSFDLSDEDKQGVISFIDGTHPLPLLVAGGSGVDVDRIEYLLNDCRELGIVAPFTLDEAITAFSIRNGTLHIKEGFACVFRNFRLHMYHDVYHGVRVRQVEKLIMPLLSQLVKQHGFALTEQTIRKHLEEVTFKLPSEL